MKSSVPESNFFYPVAASLQDEKGDCRSDYGGGSQEKEGQGSVKGEDSLLERVTAAAEERQLSQNSLLAYRRTWQKIIAWAAAEGLVLETLPSERAGNLGVFD